MSRIIPLSEVVNHKSVNDCWVVVDGVVYDVTKFLDEHPGGKKVLLKEGGTDASKKFAMFHGPDVIPKYGPRLRIGFVEGRPAAAKASAASSPAPSASAAAAAAAAGGARSVVASKGGEKKSVKPYEPYGEQVPYGDPNWYQSLNTAYYKPTHVKWRTQMRAFVEKEVSPFVGEWDDKKGFSKELFVKAAQVGILATVLGVWPKDYVDPSVPIPDDLDLFHELILIDECSRCGSGGLLWGLYGGLSIGLPPILNFGSQYLKDKVARDCLAGKKFICLAITEPEAGSDVANIHTTARKEGDYYIVNGAKKWITNGVFADYFTVAVRTGGAGNHGISLLLVEKTMPGVATRQMACMGVWASGTTYITFEDVKVPAANLIGKENEGFKMIMYNFNHERWALAVQASRFARVCLEESVKYALKRKTFGKPLIEHQLIRFKIAEMARQVESTHAWLENITFQLTTMSKVESNAKLGGTIALLKVQTTKTFEYCAREAAQIFGGASYVRGGVGEKIERLYREVRAYAIPGGSEEILLDLAAREAMKFAAKKSKL